MKKVWYKENPAVLEKIKKEVNSVYPNLHFYLRNDLVFIRGSFPVLYDGKVLDRYVVEIELLRDYPKSVPVVREVGGRIPRTVDYHMDEKGEACLFLPEERWKVCPASTTFLDFLKGPVHNFFLGQSLVRLGQPWPFGAWAHGRRGKLEYYIELIGTKDSNVILRYLDYLSKPKIKGHWDCPCGSGKRLRNCHFNKILGLRNKITPELAKKSFDEIYKLLRK